MYQQGIEQGNPAIAAAIGVVLVIGTLIIAALQNRFAEREETDVASSASGARADVVLGLGALAFLFPFYYMFIGSLQNDRRHRRCRAPSRTRATYRQPTTSTSTPRINLGQVAGQLGHLHRWRAAVHAWSSACWPGYALARAALPRPRHDLRARCCWCRWCRSSC